MPYSCRVLADSVGPNGVRLTTIEASYPRLVHAELMTHRVFSRNTASSRAIPIQKMIERVKDDPVIPIHWGRNQKGMQAEAEIGASAQVCAQDSWLEARDLAVTKAQELLQLGVHKQVVNRLLEPFMWVTCIITATEWDNFFGLRCHPDAQPEIRHIAEMIRAARAASVPRVLRVHQWHLPLVGVDEPDLVACEAFAATTDNPARTLARVSAGRCARVSYLTHDGARDPAADLALCERLLASGHMSPLEHPAVCLSDTYEIDMSLSYSKYVWSRDQYFGNLRGWQHLRWGIPGEAVFKPCTNH